MPIQECWEWQGVISHGGPGTGGGYGRIDVNGRTKYAHRVVYELLVGPIPEGHQLDHLCRNRACVNPSHLEPVTARENLMRGESPSAKHAAKTTCPEGHPYDRVITRGNGRQTRRCSICERARQIHWYVSRGVPARAFERGTP